MRVFLDFEASSLADDSYPIEVGWVFETGEGESYLIRPADDWLDWNVGGGGDTRSDAPRSRSRRVASQFWEISTSMD